MWPLRIKNKLSLKTGLCATKPKIDHALTSKGYTTHETGDRKAMPRKEPLNVCAAESRQTFWSCVEIRPRVRYPRVWKQLARAINSQEHNARAISDSASINCANRAHPSGLRKGAFVIRPRGELERGFWSLHRRYRSILRRRLSRKRAFVFEDLRGHLSFRSQWKIRKI